MRRRDFIQGIAISAVAWPPSAGAQRSAMPVIGYLNSRASGADPPLLEAFRQGLKEAGYIEGRNINIEYRFGEDHNERLPGLASELVQREVAVIVANGPAVMSAKAATVSIPIVFAIGFDPIQLGLVASLNHPGGNITGVVTSFDEIGPKKLELAHDLIPAANNFAALVNPSYPSTAAQTRDLEAAAKTLGIQLHILSASSKEEIVSIFATVTKLRAAALIIGNDPFFNSRSEQLAELSVHNAVPCIFQTRAFAIAGGLISYGPSLADSYRAAGIYTGRILKGEKPGDLPVQESTKFEIRINLKTAKGLGLKISPDLLSIANEVIE